jgi:tetratricopeptide (TPR) repeat protein
MMSMRWGFVWILVFSCLLSVNSFAQSDDNAAAQLSSAGRQALAAGDYAEAQAAFEKLSRLEPSVAEIHATLAAICFKRREYEKAVAEIRTAQKLKPGLPRLDSLLGLSLSELGRYEEALPNLEKGFKQTTDPASRRLCGLQMMRAYSNLNRDADAVEVALELNKLYPNDPEVLYHTGRVYGNYAYVTMMKLHDSAPNSIWMLQAQGEANESQKNYDAAIIAFNHVLEIDPRRPGIHYRLGRVYLSRFRDSQRSEDRDNAMREFQAELAVDPGNGNALYEIANLDASTGNIEEATRQFEDLLKQYPDFEEALVGLGGLYLDSKKPADAVALLTRATKLRPDDEVAWYRLAQAEHGTGDRDGQARAMDTFRRLHNSTPGTLRRPDASDEITPQQLGTVEQP